MDHIFASEWLLIHLNHWRYCLSYKDVQRCKQSILSNKSPFDTVRNGTFSQWLADKVDQNVRTLDGRRILNAMDMVLSATEGNVKAIRNKLPAISREQLRNVTITMSVKISCYTHENMKN